MWARGIITAFPARVFSRRFLIDLKLFLVGELALVACAWGGVRGGRIAIMVRRRLMLKLRSCKEEEKEWPRDGLVSAVEQVNECNILCGIGVPITLANIGFQGGCVGRPLSCRRAQPSSCGPHWPLDLRYVPPCPDQRYRSGGRFLLLILGVYRSVQSDAVVSDGFGDTAWPLNEATRNMWLQHVAIWIGPILENCRTIY